MTLTPGIKLISLSLEPVEVVGLLANLELKLVDVLKIVLAQTLTLLTGLRRARLLRRRLRLLEFHSGRRH